MRDQYVYVCYHNKPRGRKKLDIDICIVKAALAEGKTQREIAKQFGCTIRTIRHHLRRDEYGE